MKDFCMRNENHNYGISEKTDVVSAFYHTNVTVNVQRALHFSQIFVKNSS